MESITYDEFILLISQWKNNEWVKGRCINTSDWLRGEYYESLMSYGDLIIPFLVKWIKNDAINKYNKVFPALVLYEAICAKNHPEMIAHRDRSCWSEQRQCAKTIKLLDSLGK